MMNPKNSQNLVDQYRLLLQELCKDPTFCKILREKYLELYSPKSNIKKDCSYTSESEAENFTDYETDTDVEEITIKSSSEIVIPDKFVLKHPYPNPFNPKTVISWQLPSSSDVKLNVYNFLGQKISTLVSEELPAGYHEVEFNGDNLSSGVYLYRIEAGEWQDVKKMILIR